MMRNRIFIFYVPIMGKSVFFYIIWWIDWYLMVISSSNILMSITGHIFLQWFMAFMCNTRNGIILIRVKLEIIMILAVCGEWNQNSFCVEFFYFFVNRKLNSSLYFSFEYLCIRLSDKEGKFFYFFWIFPE